MQIVIAWRTHHVNGFSAVTALVRQQFAFYYGGLKLEPSTSFGFGKVVNTTKHKIVIK